MEAHELKAFLQVHNYVEDRWGHFKKTHKDGKVHRYKMQKTSVRHEVKLGESGNAFWYKRWSEYYCNLEINENDKIARKKELAEEVKIPEKGEEHGERN